ncbi:hypothetical protein NKR23_g5274 [Pleurostoma richardsiae]|uniref:GPI inositol-deacylase n=1 Tax=Pleurostoma richardsiae TaxID=41990 RepID=A0AA38RE04_9PEZI|nr:hypothetical protein NKR23_g5274 [Pleurostoma richardsiae]
MKLNRDEIRSIGLTVLYEPDDPNGAVVDVVLIHGLGGHPIRTWLHTTHLEPKSRESPKRSASLKALMKKGNTLKKKPNPDIAASFEEQPMTTESMLTPRLRLEMKEEPMTGSGKEIYWPLDLLPESCPNTRIIAWGFLTLAVNGKLLPAQDDVFANARGFLDELLILRGEARSHDRALILIAHSTGGLVVKEVLRLAESDELRAKDILPSLCAVILLGCPNRGTQEGSLGDAITDMASLGLRVSAADETLRGLSGPTRLELELGRQTFIRLWNDYNFVVKTFQEAVPILSLRRQDAQTSLVSSAPSRQLIC